MRSAKFKLETFPGEIFSGQTNDDSWNGWAYPYFSFDEAQNITNLQNQLPGNSALYDKDKDTFIFRYRDEIEEYTGETHNGSILYPIGSGSWIWEEDGNN